MSTPAKLTPRLLKAPNAAFYLGMSETKLRELVDQGRIARPSRQDGMVRWDIRDLDEYADSLRDARFGASNRGPIAV